MSVLYKLALIIKNSLNENEFLLVKQICPPKFHDEEYDSYIDSDLWDLPATQLNPFEGDSQSKVHIEGSDSCLGKINLREFDVQSALNQILLQVDHQSLTDGKWAFCKYVEEPDFGPGPPVHTVFISGKLIFENDNIREMTDVFKWMSNQSCLDLLLGVKQSNDRIGLLIVIGRLNDHMQSGRGNISCTLPCQEYPPGVKLVPMGSKTAKPFRTTSLVIISPDNVSDCCEDADFAAANGDALIIDPGCRSQFFTELAEIVAALPRKLVVFVTHHHHDHIEGLSVVQKCNPDAILLAHESTMKRIRKGSCLYTFTARISCLNAAGDWSCGYTTVSGAEEICIGGQRLKVIFAPGHTDGHMALLDTNTQSLIVGDHCVGQGSALLDISSGGNMKDYFQTTYDFLDMSPHVLIPMHGRVNMWPKHLLCGYLKNRRSRESSILKAIEGGAQTLYDILAKTYSDVDPIYWIPASSNVRLHVDHLAQQEKLPKEFSLLIFGSSCDEFYDKVGNQRFQMKGDA